MMTTLSIFICILFILSFIILCIYSVIKNKNILTEDKQHCYAFSIETVETGIYVLSDTKLSEDEIEIKKQEVLKKIYNNNVPDDAVVGVIYMGIISNRGVK